MTETEYYKHRDALAQFLLNLTQEQKYWMNAALNNLQPRDDLKEYCLILLREAFHIGIDQYAAFRIAQSATMNNQATISAYALRKIADVAYGNIID